MVDLGNIFNGKVIKFHIATNNKSGGKTDFSDAPEVGDMKIFVNGTDTADPSAIANVSTGLYRVEWTATGIKLGDIVEFVLEPDTETLDGESVTSIVAYGRGVSSGYGAEVYFDANGTETTDDYPSGATPELACNDIDEAIKIAKNKSKSVLRFHGGGTAQVPTEGFDNGRIVGYDSRLDYLDASSWTSYSNISLERLRIKALNGGQVGKSARDCYFNGQLRAYQGESYQNCFFNDTINFFNNAGETEFPYTAFQDCEFDDVDFDFTSHGSGQKLVIVNGSGNLTIDGDSGGTNPIDVVISGFKGRIVIRNLKNAGDTVVLYGATVGLSIESSCTAGNIGGSGVGDVTDSSAGTSVSITQMVQSNIVNDTNAKAQLLLNGQVNILLGNTNIKAQTDKMNFTGTEIDSNVKQINSLAAKAVSLATLINTTNDTVDANLGRILGDLGAVNAFLASIDQSNNAIKSNIKFVDDGSSESTALKNAIDVTNSVVKSDLTRIGADTTKLTAFKAAIEVTNNTVKGDMTRVAGLVVQASGGYVLAKKQGALEIAGETTIINAIGLTLTRANYVDFMNRDATGRYPSGNPSQYTVGTSTNKEIIDVTYNTIDAVEKVDTETVQ